MMNRLDSHQLERFRRDGFLTFEPGLPAAEIAALREILASLHASNTGFHEGAAFDAIGPDDGSAPARFPQILHPRSFAPKLLDSHFYRIAHAIAQQVLGPNLRFKADISLMKPALIGEVTPFHQDEAFQDPAFDYHELSFWLALQPVDKANSCLEYIPGTHLGPVLPHGFPGGDARVHALECISGFDPADAVVCPLPAGGCVMHTGRVVHGAGRNHSDADRLAYVLIFDLVPLPARVAREFPWRRQHNTARAQRELQWRRRGGLLVHLWRQRHRTRIANPRALVFDLYRATKAVVSLISRRSNHRPAVESGR